MIGSTNAGSACQVYYLGTGTSFDVSNIPGYQNLTADNFLVVTTGITGASCDADSGKPYSHAGCSASPASIAGYNSTTGVLTVNPPGSYVNMSGYTDGSKNGSGSGGSWKVYLVKGKIK